MGRHSITNLGLVFGCFGEGLFAPTCLHGKSPGQITRFSSIVLTFMGDHRCLFADVGVAAALLLADQDSDRHAFKSFDLLGESPASAADHAKSLSHCLGTLLDQLSGD